MKNKDDLTNHSNKKNNFDSTILLIAEKSAADETTYDALFSLHEFIDIYEHSTEYVNNAAEFLSKNDFSEQEKKIAVCSMQRLSLIEYIQFSKKAEELYFKNEIDENLLKWVINPNFSDRHILVKNFDNKDVIKLLMSLKHNTTISNVFKKVIDNILSGKLADSLNEGTEK